MTRQVRSKQCFDTTNYIIIHIEANTSKFNQVSRRTDDMLICMMENDRPIHTPSPLEYFLY